MVKDADIFSKAQKSAPLGSYEEVTIVQCEPGNSILYEREALLRPHSETSWLETEGEKDVLFFISGGGIIQTNSSQEKVISGDRITTFSGERYQIINCEESDLRFKIVGVGRIG